MLPGTKAANERLRRFREGGIPALRTNVGHDEMKRMVDDALVSKRARLTGETKAEARTALASAGHISAPEPKKKPAAAVAAPAPETDSEDEELFRRLGEDEDGGDPLPVAAKSGKCPKKPRKPASSVRQTEMGMRGPNPKREGWKLPRKPYGHAKKVVELKDNLTDTELKKMTSELPRRCLVDAVADWARENNKIVLPSITRADKAEIVATIKEHRIPVPKLSGGYYGDDWGGDEDVYYDEDGKEVSKDEYEKKVSDGSEEDLPEQPQFVGDPSQFKIMPFDPNNPMMYRGSGDFDDWIENERRTTEPYEIAGAGFFDRTYSSAALTDFKQPEKEKKKKEKDIFDFSFDPDKPIEFDSDGDYEGRDMFMEGTGNKGDYLKTAKAFAKKAGYKDWNKIKYATDGVHKLELNGVKFGRKGYGDFIDYGMKEGDKEAQKHRKAYLARATNIKGSWKEDPMSKNNLAIKVLWGGSPFHHLRGGAAQPALPPNVDLVSKKESPVVEEIIEEPMDDTDIRAYYPNAKIMRYSDLSKYKTITQLLPKDKSYAFLLYQQEANSGHWVLIMRYGSTIEFFCSYGSAIDAPLKWTNPRDRQMLGEAVPYLSNLLKSQKDFNVIHNPVQYQSKGSDKATCGAHDVMRLSQMLNHGQDLTDYYDFMSRIKKESGLSYDEIVANFVSQR